MPRDPYRNFRYEVEIAGFTRAGFSKVSGLKHTIPPIDYREGGENERLRKLPGRSEFENVTFERGISDDNDFIDWIQQIFDLDNVRGEQGAVEGWRRNVFVYLKDKSGTRVVKWSIFDAWPTEDGVGDLDATGNEVLIGSLVLANEGIKREVL